MPTGDKAEESLNVQGKRVKELLGKPTIHPVLFFSGKVSGYAIWVLFWISHFRDIGHVRRILPVAIAAWIVYGCGLLLSLMSMVNLGKSTTLGIPVKETAFMTRGLYRISRNPMYLGFNLLTLGGILQALNGFVLMLGIFSMIVYHLIILKEEIFLKARFGEDYVRYQARVRRYL